MSSKWNVPENNRKTVDRAGKAFIDPTAEPAVRAEARVVINNWRSSHSFPLNTLVMTLRKHARVIDPNALVARRIKRLPSIRLKLELHQNMKLTQMQDLGGARAVLPSVPEVRLLEQKFLKLRLKHKLITHDDYIAKPKPSGYRGVHLVYKFQSDQKTEYNNLRIELQMRSRLMHAWATAVETVGTFTKHSLKSSLGPDEFLRFFALMSAAIAEEEGGAFPPGVPDDIGSVYAEIRELADKLKIIERLEAYRAGLHLTGAATEVGKFYLLQLDISESILEITTFRNLAEATAAFDAAEAATGSDNIQVVMRDVVLVKVDSVAGLRAAYPNYFLDTSEFLKRVRAIVGNDRT
ncbi:RelA/SpoT domain-containing protein [Glycomyces albidus]|uniref:(P)ppGpp synthetase n=1 Tax=Glycomyces albidus TaxID=2656774 RepID=A0A6L5GG50_9ACTN|nr:RelA/SpoT domain-containing protein [Glycomyces albidus]MQM28714.1 (p)ppGpp synthetase [Glycomyces albidus]